jgi:membrane protein implicated in regulation of membrane protease activity
VGIGGSIFLIALGAILAFAVNASLGFLDLNVVGWVLMLAGLVGLILTMWFWQSRRRPVARPTSTNQTEVVEEYREVRRPPV